MERTSSALDDAHGVAPTHRRRTPPPKGDHSERHHRHRELAVPDPQHRQPMRCGCLHLAQSELRTDLQRFTNYDSDRARRANDDRQRRAVVSSAYLHGASLSKTKQTETRAARSQHSASSCADPHESGAALKIDSSTSLDQGRSPPKRGSENSRNSGYRWSEAVGGAVCCVVDQHERLVARALHLVRMLETDQHRLTS